MPGRFMKCALAGLMVMGFALEASAAPIVHLFDTVALSIEDLEIDGVLYDVDFVESNSTVFEGDAISAANAINAALNATGIAAFVFTSVSIDNYLVHDTSGTWAYSTSSSVSANWHLESAGWFPDPIEGNFDRAQFTRVDAQQPQMAPEPATLVLLGTGLLSAGFLRRTRLRA